MGNNIFHLRETENQDFDVEWVDWNSNVFICICIYKQHSMYLLFLGSSTSDESGSSQHRNYGHQWLSCVCHHVQSKQGHYWDPYSDGQWRVSYMCTTEVFQCAIFIMSSLIFTFLTLTCVKKRTHKTLMLWRCQCACI